MGGGCLPCGGPIELVLDPVQLRPRLAGLLQRLEQGQRVRRVLTLASGECGSTTAAALVPATTQDLKTTGVLLVR